MGKRIISMILVVLMCNIPIVQTEAASTVKLEMSSVLGEIKEIEISNKKVKVIPKNEYIAKFDIGLGEITEPVTYSILIENEKDPNIRVTTGSKTAGVGGSTTQSLWIGGGDFIDGIYKATLSVEGVETNEVRFAIIRSKPKVPSITIGGQKIRIDYGPHKIIPDIYMNKEYSFDGVIYNSYTEELDLPYDKEGIIYARYKDTSGNYSLQIKNYNSYGGNTPVGSEELSSADIDIEENMSATNYYVNIRIRNSKGSKSISKNIFEFLIGR